jgi:hypothetical protein
MRPYSQSGLRVILAVAAALVAGTASAHSASDAYLTLDAETRIDPARRAGYLVVHGQWDIALRDLNFVLNLDDDGDGNITWAELRKHQDDIAKYAYGYLRAASSGKSCTIRPTRQMVDNHADGAYAALFFDIECTGPVQRLSIDYRLFFAIDPSHRGILVLRSGDNTATSLLSPDNASIELKL